MPSLLTTAASVDCGHGGAIAPKDDPLVKLTVSGAKVLTAAALIGQSVSPTCATPIAPPPPGPTSKKCLACATIGSATSTKLTVHGVPVLLAPLSGTTDGMVSNITPQTMLKATGAQSKLTAV